MIDAASADSLPVRSPLRRELARTLKESQGLDNRYLHRRRSGGFFFSDVLRRPAYN